jgi:putative PIG3 family NAD(P)H quinone oxidoreductase
MLDFAQTDIPKIKPTQCLIKVKAIGVNRADILQRQGKYPPPAGESEILGLEVCGDIIKCGSQVRKWQSGDKVFALVAGGGYAEYVAVNSEHLIALPASLSYQQGAAIAEVFLTAYQSLFSLADLKVKQHVLIHAGASGVGSAAIQLAKTKQCNVTVTVGSTQKADACLGLGADNALNYREQDFVSWAKQHHQTGFNVIVDVVAGEYLMNNIKVAAMDAHIIILSMLGGRFSAPIDIAKLLSNRITIHASTLRNRSDDYKAKLVNAFVNDFYEALTTGIIKPVLSDVLPWQQAELAHKILLDNANIGKVILTID